MTNRYFAIYPAGEGWIVALVTQRAGEPNRRIRTVSGPFSEQKDAKRALAEIAGDVGDIP